MIKNIYKTFVALLILVSFSTLAKSQNHISDLMVYDIAINDSIIDMVMVDFNCNNIEQIERFEIAFDQTEGYDGIKRLYPVIEKESVYYITLLNKEEIPIIDSKVAFVTKVPRPGLIPFFSISIKGFRKDGLETNTLTFTR